MCNHSKSLGEESVQGWSCPADRPPAQTNTHWEVVLGGSVLCPIFRVFCWGVWWSPETVTISPPLQRFLVFWVGALRGEEQGSCPEVSHQISLASFKGFSPGFEPDSGGG